MTCCGTLRVATRAMHEDTNKGSVTKLVYFHHNLETNENYLDSFVVS